MNESKAYDPKVKAALEYGPLLAFMLGYWWFKDQNFTLGGQTYTGFIAVTAVFVLVFVASILALWRLTGKISAMQVVTLVVVLFMGGLSIWFNDEQFFKMKPTSSTSSLPGPWASACCRASPISGWSCRRRCRWRRRAG